MCGIFGWALSELLSLGHRFRTASDTEVLIEAYRAWNLEAICRFRGMFALALWDAKTQRLVLARDAFGKKPLFIAERPGALLFGSLRPELELLIPYVNPKEEVLTDGFPSSDLHAQA
jgi:asparagine synthase (glutamine-hydrolysing)